MFLQFSLSSAESSSWILRQTQHVEADTRYSTAPISSYWESRSIHSHNWEELRIFRRAWECFNFFLKIKWEDSNTEHLWKVKLHLFPNHRPDFLPGETILLFLLYFYITRRWLHLKNIKSRSWLAFSNIQHRVFNLQKELWLFPSPVVLSDLHDWKATFSASLSQFSTFWPSNFLSKLELYSLFLHGLNVVWLIFLPCLWTQAWQSEM